jgi:hypothetical protein
MERSIALVLLLLVLAVLEKSQAAFVVDSSAAARRNALTVRTPIGDGSYATTHLFMFDNDKPPAPLEMIDAPVKDQPMASTTTSNIVLDKTTGEVREVKWVDPAMSANENPFNMGWYVSSIFFLTTNTQLTPKEKNKLQPFDRFSLYAIFFNATTGGPTLYSSSCPPFYSLTMPSRLRAVRGFCPRTDRWGSLVGSSQEKGIQDIHKTREKETYGLGRAPA